MFEFVGNLVGGGWDAISNITSGIGKGASSFVSGFFPAAQRTTTIPTIAAARENQGLTYRPVSTDAPSLWQAATGKAMTGAAYGAIGQTPPAAAQPSLWSRLWSGAKTAWSYTPAGIVQTASYNLGNKIGSFFFGPTATPAMTKAAGLANQWLTEAEKPQPTGLGKMLQDVYNFAEDFAAGGEKVLTLADRIQNLGMAYGLISPRQTTAETPRAGAAEGMDVQHLNKLSQMGADVLSGIAATAGSMMEQVKGLFNLGYSGPTGGQPVFSIAHEIEPSKQTTYGLIIAAVVLFVLYLIFRRKK